MTFFLEFTKANLALRLVEYVHREGRGERVSGAVRIQKSNSDASILFFTTTSFLHPPLLSPHLLFNYIRRQRLYFPLIHRRRPAQNRYATVSSEENETRSSTHQRGDG